MILHAANVLEILIDSRLLAYILHHAHLLLELGSRPARVVDADSVLNLHKDLLNVQVADLLDLGTDHVCHCLRPLNGHVHHMYLFVGVVEAAVQLVFLEHELLVALDRIADVI